MKKSDFNKLDKNELIDLLMSLCKLNKANDLFLQSKLRLNHDDLLNLSYKKIDKAFSSLAMMSLKDARQALNDFKKSAPTNDLLMELYVYYINKAYQLEKTDWRFQENFYSAIESVYGLIFEIMKKDLLLKDKYNSKIKGLINISNESYGHRDYLKDKFYEM
jgi:hypothetical protein